MESRFRSIAHVLIIVFLCVFVLTCGAYNCYALSTTTTMALTFTGQPAPPQGAVFVLEVGPQTYSCATVGTKCAFAVDTNALNTEIAGGRGVCFYERAHPDHRDCQWFVDMKVQQGKRRVVRR